MKQFLKILVGFITVVAICAVCVDFAITRGLRNYTDYVSESWNDLRDTSYNPDMLILGSCQALCNYDPYVFDSVLGVESYVYGVYNMSLPAEVCAWQLYKKYHPNHLPKYVLWSLDYADLDYREVKNSVVADQFLPLVYDKEVRDFLLTYGGYDWYEIYIPCYRYYGFQKRIKYGLRGFILPQKHYGQRAKYKGHEILHGNYEFSHSDLPDNNYTKVQQDLVVMLDSAIKDMQNQGTQVVLVVSPLGNELASLIANITDVFVVYDMMSKKHEISYLNYYESAMSQDTSLFVTPPHMNECGAIRYTAIVADTLNSIWKK